MKSYGMCRRKPPCRAVDFAGTLSSRSMSSRTAELQESEAQTALAQELS
jgi:hypothetical protein